MGDRVVVIGAGISGLSAGCYAAMNGYDVQVHEAHTLPGGLCTSWRRGDYLVDGCIHWLTGTNPKSSLYRIWEELGVVQGRRFFDHEVFSRMVSRDGRVLHWYTDPDRLEDHLRGLAPTDAAPVKELCGLIRKMMRFSYPAGRAPELVGTLAGLRTMARLAPYLRPLMRLNDLTTGRLAAPFKDPLVRAGVANFIYDEGLPAVALVMTLASMAAHDAGYPLGGSADLARAVERRLLGLEGKIHYGSRVEKVLEREAKVVGVRLQGGDEVAADHVIAACDMRHVLFSLLDGSRIDPVHEELLATARIYPPLMLVNMGLDLDTSGDISCVGTAYELDEPVEFAGRRVTYFGIKNFSYDPAMAPPGKSVVGSGTLTDWTHWEPLLADREAYRAEKERIAAIFADQLETRHPGAAARIEMTDVATPYTFARYTGSWHGTFMTWILSNDFQRRHRYIPKTVPGLAGLHIAGMWTDPPGGIPGGASAGREVVQLICHEDRRRFLTTTP